MKHQRHHSKCMLTLIFFFFLICQQKYWKIISPYHNVRYSIERCVCVWIYNQTIIKRCEWYFSIPIMACLLRQYTFTCGKMLSVFCYSLSMMEFHQHHITFFSGPRSNIDVIRARFSISISNIVCSIRPILN